MSLLVNRIILAVLVGGIAVVVGAHLFGQQRSPVMVTRLYTGSDGQTHQDLIEVKFTPSTILQRCRIIGSGQSLGGPIFPITKGESSRLA